MIFAHHNGRRIGALLLVQMASALILPFVLIDALKRGYPSFLETAASASLSIRAGVIVSFLGAGLTLAIGISMLPVLRQFSQAAAIFFLVLCAASSTIDLAHNATVISMLSVGEQYASAAGADNALYQAWGIAAASMRRSAHIVQLFAIAAWIFTFYLSLLRFRLVPIPLAALGIAGILSQFTGVTLMMFLGYSPITSLAMPLAPIHAVVAFWLIFKDLRRPSAVV